MSIKEWPAAERPREKLLEQGASVLSDAELLAIFLRTGVAGKSAVDLARELLTRFGGLRQLLEAKRDDFNSAYGLGDAKFCQLQAVLEMARRHLKAQLIAGDLLNNPQVVGDYLQTKLRHRQREVFSVLLLDTQHRLVRYEEVFEGTLDSANVYPREILNLALKHNAASVILAHYVICQVFRSAFFHKNKDLKVPSVLSSALIYVS